MTDHSFWTLLIDQLDLSPRPRPARRPLKDRDYTRYSFEKSGNMRLTDWMAQHLKIVFQPGKDAKKLRDELIRDLRPPLNLTGWANPNNDLIRAARKRCADQARRNT